MKIILLSGGSGKRLWPLSNDIRSKQFIRILKNKSGQYESMVERVYRQLITVMPDADITIATSKSQVSAIRSQLGDRVSVCVEPSRRDTFPAILLATAYLRYELSVSDEEYVAVCPIDPYVDDSYYECVNRMELLAKQSEAKLTLMGIEPTYPSDKYGYIIPENIGTVSEVSAFKEKPNSDTAAEYLKQGALWNAGIFVFRLGYLLEKSHSIVSYTDYRDLYMKYNSLDKISFDYAIVEKEPSIQVVRYVGEWRDIGSWNMMTEVMPDRIRGNVILDDSCKNTNVINELNVPILCMGCTDMVVAASGDGILVSKKDKSGGIKPYVERINNDVRYADKSWGTYTVLDVQQSAMTIKITMKSGSHMSYHSHELRDEVWTIVSGKGRVIVDEMEQPVFPGDVVSIAAGCKHTIIADTDMYVVEVQVGDEISKADKTTFDMPGSGL